MQTDPPRHMSWVTYQKWELQAGWPSRLPPNSGSKTFVGQVVHGGLVDFQKVVRDYVTMFEIGIDHSKTGHIHSCLNLFAIGQHIAQGHEDFARLGGIPHKATG